MSSSFGPFTLQLDILGADSITQDKDTFTVYNITVGLHESPQSWVVPRRYSEFHALHSCLASKFPDHKFPTFPGKTLLPSRETVLIETRKFYLTSFLRDLASDPAVSNCDEVYYFLNVKQHLYKPDRVYTVLMPLPDKDFDPTESAVPWKLCVLEGFRFVFATEQGTVAAADQQLLHPDGVLMSKLAAEPEARLLYDEMEKCYEFQHPIRWSDIQPHDYDALLLVGGHAPGMKQYLESHALQEKIAAFWKLRRAVGAICHGALLLARTRDPDTGVSVLDRRHTTTLPKYMENLAYSMTFWKLGKQYRTYEVHCADEVKSCLSVPDTQYEAGPTTVGTRGSYYDDSAAFVCEDANYISARWPGDAYLFGKRFVALVKRSAPVQSPAAAAGAADM